MAEYLQYIPIIFTNPTANAILLTSVPAVLYTAAAYGHLFVKGASLGFSILLSVLFATLEYIVRVPIIKYSHDVAQMSNGTMQLIWILLTGAMSFASDGFLPKLAG